MALEARTPASEPHEDFAAFATRHGLSASAGERPVVAVQGLGFVGAAMATAIAAARGSDGAPVYNVVGIDLATEDGARRIGALNAGRFPFATEDNALAAAVAAARREGNLIAAADAAGFAFAHIAVVDVPLDVDESGPEPAVDFAPFRTAVRTLGAHLPEGALVLVESTVPPGTCERVVAPELARALAARGLAADALLLAHSYERIMPGPDYLASITHYWRVYAGRTEAAAEACRRFLDSIIDTARFPLTRLATTTESETAKVLENSFRAVTIAAMDEWGRFAEAAGVDLFAVADAIRLRPSHANLRDAGFGVGGYCLPKDPLLAGISARALFGRDDIAFPVAEHAVAVNRAMPLGALDRLETLLDGLAGKRLLLAGVSYRAGLDDTRGSSSETFWRAAQARGAEVLCHDPMVRRWAQLGLDLPDTLPRADGIDALVLAVAHAEYRAHDWAAWAGAARPLIFDANNVLDAPARARIKAAGLRLVSLGRGRGT